MADNTSIQWTDATWNPIAGCSIVSPGCTNCYAMHQAAALERRFGSEKYSGLTKTVNGNPVWTGEVRLHEPALDQPLRWKRGRRIFVNSMSDLFHENLPDEAIDRIFAVMALAPQHTFQVLTKRPERMRAYCQDQRTPFRVRQAMDVASPIEWPLPNCWKGVTAEDQERADERIPILLDTPAAKRFISAEPLLGPIDLTRLREHRGLATSAFNNCLWSTLTGENIVMEARQGTGVLDWVIAGFESGRDARGGLRVWAQFLGDQCIAASASFFWKQNGEWIDADEWFDGLTYPPMVYDDRGKAVLWAAPRPLNHTDAAQLAEFCGRRGKVEHQSDGSTLIRVGKNAAGRLLDGREWSEFPA